MTSTSPREAGSTVTTLASAIYHGGSRLESVPGLVKQVLTDDLWRSYALPGGGPLAEYDHFPTFVRDGLSINVNTLRDLCRRDYVALGLLEGELAGKRGRPSANGQKKGASGTVLRGSNQRGYALRRLAKTRPDLHQKVIAGEMSPHKAMVEAGFSKKQITVPTDPARAARTLRKHFSEQALRELLAHLQE